MKSKNEKEGDVIERTEAKYLHRLSGDIGTRIQPICESMELHAFLYHLSVLCEFFLAAAAAAAAALHRPFFNLMNQTQTPSSLSFPHVFHLRST